MECEDDFKKDFTFQNEKVFQFQRLHLVKDYIRPKFLDYSIDLY